MIYEYKCDCGKEFEEIVSVDDRDNVYCSCGKKAKRKLSNLLRNKPMTEV